MPNATRKKPPPGGDAVVAFLTDISTRGQIRVLGKTAGTIRIDAADGDRPVQYPTACSPQACSTGAPLLFIRTLLGLEPVDDHLIVDPVVPVEVGQLELLDVPGRWGRIDAFGRALIEIAP